MTALQRYDEYTKDQLKVENAELRRELEKAWIENHSEHCGWEWPHSPG